jgi:hyperosmotically inducible protein
MKIAKHFGSQVAFTTASLLLSATMLSGAAFQQAAPDNSKNNQGDASNGAMTAQKQAMNPADRELTRKIRHSLMQDKSLSTYAHNIKIISQDGKVTLKGPVNTDDEKAAIQAKAVAIAGADNVSNEIQVTPAQ